MYPTRHTQVNCVRVRVSTSLSFQCNTLQYRCQFVLFAKNICNNIHLLKPCRRCILINIILLINHVFVVRNTIIPEYNECIEHTKCATDLRNKSMSYCPRETLKKSSQRRKNPINVNILQSLTVVTDWCQKNLVPNSDTNRIPWLRLIKITNKRQKKCSLIKIFEKFKKTYWDSTSNPQSHYSRTSPLIIFYFRVWLCSCTGSFT